MSGRKTIQDYVPAVREQACGFSDTAALMYAGPALTTGTNKIAAFTFPAADLNNRGGYARHAAHLNLMVTGPGTGQTGGSWVFTVTDANGLTLGTATIAYNASPLSASIDLRDVTGKGVSLLPGDTIYLNLTGVPTGSPTGLIGAFANVTFHTYGLKA